MMTPETRAGIEAFQRALTRMAGIATDTIADATDQWLRRQHAPYPDEDGGYPVCIHASHGKKRSVPWPCDVELAACERIDRRAARREAL